MIYTGKGDDGTTGLYLGGRVAKNSAVIRATGAADEAQTAVGFARAAVRVSTTPQYDAVLIQIERNLWVLMAEINVEDKNRTKLEPGKSAVTQDMLDDLEENIKALDTEYDIPTDFIVPGQEEVSARLELARVAVRRAERECIEIAMPDSLVIPYLNRLSSYLWALARVFEKQALMSKEGK